MKITRCLSLLLLALAHASLFAHSDSSDTLQTDTYTGIATLDTIQVEAYSVAAPNRDQLICFDLKSLQYRKCGSDNTEALTNMPIYYDLTGITDDQTFCYDRKNQNYIRCTVNNDGHYLVHIPEGYEMAAAADRQYGHLTFYCRWKANPEWTVDCDVAQHNVAPNLNSILKIPAGKVVVGVSHHHDRKPCSRDRVYNNIYFINTADYTRLKTALDKRWNDYQRAFPDGK